MPLPIVRVSRSSQGHIERGHPWLLPDRFTEWPAGVAAGAVVHLAGPAGRPFALALADPAGEVAARVVSMDPQARFDPRAAVRKAWARRGRFHADAGTNCWRAVHGEADGLPGIRVEVYAGTVVVVAFAAAAVPHLDAVCDELAGLRAWERIVVKHHLDDLRREEATTRIHAGAPGDATTLVRVRELGVELVAHPCGGLATGIYVDQRGTRRWLRKQASGRRVLNLFAYTGVFSTSLLQAGAVSAVDVDIAAPALEQAAANAALQGAAQRHRTVQGAAAEVLASDEGLYDLIIVDPPTAAQGSGSWVLRRDYPEVLRLAWRRLAPGGLLVAVCNTLGKSFPLDDEMAALGGAAVEPPALDPDLPQLAGFPEGRPFRLAVRRA